MSRGPRFIALALLGALLLAPALGRGASALPDTRHEDWRGTPRLQCEPVWAAPAGLGGVELARAFLAERAAAYGLQPDQADLALVRVQESLLGTHYHFAQTLAELPVAHGEVIVSIAKADGRVYQAYNNYYPLRSRPALPAHLDEDAAYELAWQALRAQGELLSSPAARLEWQAESGEPRLVWQLSLELEAPYGHWAVALDAVTGELLDIADSRLYRVPDEFTTASPAERIGALTGPTGDRLAAFARFTARAAADKTPTGGTRAMGSGKVFDPDPRATLLNDGLQDTSPASAFTAAYFTRTLSDITFSGGLYRVTGPWINIINWDPPATAPSTTTDGNWTATRGNNAFNDAMTYYMIDTNQRYMQSLGFTGATGIQELSIGVDTDGVSGQDNSYYVSGTNRIAYGHGCVDDSEDSDVMLHEYGHAIQFDINSNWGSGDTGAIGEGFGDYWAGSYSYSTPNGATYHPEWVFSWDGHGTGNQCWAGRLMNKLNLVYVHSTYYGAHQSIPGGQSDELWSTPLFQSLITLVGTYGKTRDSVDQIVLESHFGIGYGPKMRDMAYATIAAAQSLQPGQPHAAVFTQKFAHHNIVTDLTAVPGDESNTPAASLRLAQNSPNPFNPKTTIRFTLPAAGRATLSVFDVAGRQVAVLADADFAAGNHEIAWDGRDTQGKPLGSGVYFYRLETAAGSATRKMLLVK